MVRKTVAIRDELYNNLNREDYNSFSELVSVALKLLIEKSKENGYRKSMVEASQDSLYLQDLKDVENDFKFSDFELIK